MKKETIAFKSEVSKILDLVINSLYSHKDIFLRELISNSSDALDKLRFESITNEKLLDNTVGDLKIKIIPDKNNKTLIISDNGIGMNHDEIIKNIGTIAHSGSKEFIEKLQKTKNKEQADLIGQFGVGFYSSFMVASKIELITRKAGEEKAYKWISEGKEDFVIEDAVKETTGTDVILYLKEDNYSFLEEYKIRETIKKHSDFISYPIVIDIEHEIDKEGTKGKEVKEEILNSQKAIWARAKNEIKDEEYDEFYKHLTHDYEKPLFHIHQHSEGAQEYKALLYIPKKAPMDLFYHEKDYGLNLYIKRVFITNKCEELIPHYLRFVKGVVDSSDLPLNVSREILQDNPLLKIINNNLTSKILKTLKTLQEKEIEKYLDFYKEFGKIIKEGLNSDFKNRELLMDLLLFESNKTEYGKYISLKEYIERMTKSQEAIYYITGDKRTNIEHSPHLEAFKKNGIEVLFLTDHIDEWVIPSVGEYQKKLLKSVLKEDTKVEDEKTSTEKENKEKKEKTFTSLIDFIQNELKNYIKEVKISDRLVDSPCCLVADKHGMTPQMERMMKAMNQNMPISKPVLEINIDHPILKKMKSLHKNAPKDKDLKDYAQLLHDQALFAEGSEVKNKSFFIKKMNELMIKGM